MFERTTAILAVLLTFMTLLAQAQTATAATGTSSTRTESFWHEAPSLVPIKLLVPADDPEGEPRTLIVALHGFGGSTQEFQHVGDHLAEAGFVVALPESPYSFMTDSRELGFDWTLSHGGGLAVETRATVGP